MTALLESREVSGSTNISTDLEELWRKQFFAAQGQTPAGTLPDLRVPETENSLRRMTSTVQFSGGLYDPAIIRFYEDVILELQKQVVRYKTLWEETAKVREEIEESYVARQTVKPSADVVKKLRSRTKSRLKLSAE
jgi:hypothetical protein